MSFILVKMLKKITNCLVILSLVLCSMYANLAIASAEHDLTAILSNMKSLEANFKQHTLTANSEATREFSGDLKILKPSKFYWKVTKPSNSLVIVTDQVVFNYDEDLEQVTLRNVDENFLNSPLSDVLSGSDINKIKKDFSITYYGACKQSNNCFELNPVNTDDGFARVMIGFYNGKLSYAKIFDNLGQISEMFFDNVKLNGPVSEKNFVINIPSGVDVIREK